MEDYEFTAEQQRAFDSLRKAFAKCRRAKVMLFNYYGAIYGVNGKNY